MPEISKNTVSAIPNVYKYIDTSMLITGVTTVLTMTFLGLEARTDLPQVISYC